MKTAREILMVQILPLVTTDGLTTRQVSEAIGADKATTLLALQQLELDGDIYFDRNGDPKQWRLAMKNNKSRYLAVVVPWLEVIDFNYPSYRR